MYVYVRLRVDLMFRMWVSWVDFFVEKDTFLKEKTAAQLHQMLKPAQRYFPLLHQMRHLAQLLLILSPPPQHPSSLLQHHWDTARPHPLLFQLLVVRILLLPFSADCWPCQMALFVVWWWISITFILWAAVRVSLSAFSLLCPPLAQISTFSCLASFSPDLFHPQVGSRRAITSSSGGS